MKKRSYSPEGLKVVQAAARRTAALNRNDETQFELWDKEVNTAKAAYNIAVHKAGGLINFKQKLTPRPPKGLWRGRKLTPEQLVAMRANASKAREALQKKYDALKLEAGKTLASYTPPPITNSTIERRARTASARALGTLTENDIRNARYFGYPLTENHHRIMVELFKGGKINDIAPRLNMRGDTLSGAVGLIYTRLGAHKRKEALSLYASQYPERMQGVESQPPVTPVTYKGRGSHPNSLANLNLGKGRPRKPKAQLEQLDLFNAAADVTLADASHAAPDKWAEVRERAVELFKAILNNL